MGMKALIEGKIAGLRCVVQQGEAKGPAVVLFHGYGADQHDLAPLADYMGLGPRYSWYFPNGVMEIIVGPGMTGRAWWQIDVRRYEVLLQSGEQADLSKSRPAGMDIAVERALKFYDEICKSHEKVIVGGFSQGSMLAFEVAMKAAKKPRGLILLSGNLVDQSTAELLVKNNKGMNFIQSHGVNDVILSHQGAEKLNQLLLGAGLKGKFISFRGGHEIPPQVLKDVSQFISNHS